MNISMSGKRALTATGPSQSAVAPRQGRRRSVPTEPVADGPFTGPSTATGPFSPGDGPSGNRAYVASCHYRIVHDVARGGLGLSVSPDRHTVLTIWSVKVGSVVSRD